MKQGKKRRSIDNLTASGKTLCECPAFWRDGMGGSIPQDVKGFERSRISRSSFTQIDVDIIL